MAFYLLTINKSNDSLISAKKKIRKISLFRFLIKLWRQHPQGHALQHACMLQQEVLFCPRQRHRGYILPELLILSQLSSAMDGSDC